jgi:gluconokinase
MSMAASPPVSEPLLIVVMGVSGCGKSSVGEAIATHFGLAFIEGDSLHPDANVEKMAAGIPLEDSDRWPWLDRIGTELEAAKQTGRGIVISCSALKKIYRERLRAAAGGRLWFVFLKGDKALLLERMSKRQGHFMPVALLESQLKTLENPSAEAHVITIDIRGPRNDVIARTVSEVEQRVGASQ